MDNMVDHIFILEGEGKVKDYNGSYSCLLYTSDAADERSSVDLGGRRIIKKKKNNTISGVASELPTMHIHN